LLTPRETLTGTAALARSGLVRAYRPDHLLRVGLGLARYQLGPGMGPTAGAAFYPDAIAMTDDAGSVTMRQLDARCSAVAHGLSRIGMSAGDAIGILARNSAAVYEAAIGASRLGLDVAYLNTGFTGDHVAELVERYRLRLLVHDAEFADRLPTAVPRMPTEDDRSAGGTSVARIAAESAHPVAPPSRQSRHIILTSGTTGAPRGVPRSGGGIDSIIALLSGLPLRARETHLLAAPLFHAWGWLNMMLTMLLSSTVVLTRRFDPERTLALIERERCHVLVAVPTMLQRIMDLPAGTRRRYDVSSLRVVAVSGSAVSGPLAYAFMAEYGEILYSLYGSTEAGFAAVATPVDLRTAPGTAGRPLPLVRVRVADAYGRTCPPGVAGSIRVSSRDAVQTDDAHRDDASVRTGDLGWIDQAGRLFVGAREDDMVIVGGENVYPIVVEQVLERHPDITEAAVVGAADRVLGQVLVAHVAMRDGGTATPAGIHAWCQAQLPPFQVPRRIVIHDHLPRNETGKVIKRGLR
jgi:fatty-acyl-CoA synthase